jgi:hypothetical protein
MNVYISLRQFHFKFKFFYVFIVSKYILTRSSGSERCDIDMACPQNLLCFTYVHAECLIIN